MYKHTIRNQNAMKKHSQKTSVHPRTRVGSVRSSFLLPAQQDIFVDIAAPLHKIDKTLVPAESLLLPPRVPFDSQYWEYNYVQCRRNDNKRDSQLRRCCPLTNVLFDFTRRNLYSFLLIFTNIYHFNILFILF